MLQRLRQAGLVWPTLATLVGLAVLIGLGTWQMERKRWKEDLLARIAAGANAEPVAFPPVLGEPGPDVVILKVREQDLRSFLEQWLPEYRHVVVRGRFLHGKEQYLYAPTPAGLGWHVYTPLVIASSEVLWINRGLVPDARKAPATRPQGQVSGEVEVRGLVRYPAAKGPFTPQNDVQ